jgi:hypothetical protein
VSALSINVTHALGVMELGFLVGAVDEADLTIAYRVKTLHGLLVHYDEAVIRAI